MFICYPVSGKLAIAQEPGIVTAQPVGIAVSERHSNSRTFENGLLRLIAPPRQASKLMHSGLMLVSPV